jgi:beta-N-acetylhexosaminidase
MKNAFITGVISRMSAEQKVGAILTLGFAGTVVRPHIRDAILKYHCGGLRLTPALRLFGSYVEPVSGKTILDVIDNRGYKRDLPPPAVDAEQYAAILDGLQSLALSRPLGIPLHFSFDQEGGTSADFDFGGVNFFPKPMGLRATGDPNLAYLTAKAVARQSKAVGFNWLHSPVLDVNSDPGNPEIYTRAYSDKAEVVAEYAVKTCEGLKDGLMIATGKHFPGRGASKQDAHFGTPTITVDKETMLARELLPYRELIKRD